MNQNRKDQFAGSDTPTAREAESTLQELPDRSVANAEAQDVRGGLNPQPLPPSGGDELLPPDLVDLP
jgi:hypothetical protein